MTEHESDKMGLQKEVSSIFKGVRIPRGDDAQRPTSTPEPQNTDSTRPKPAPPENQRPPVPLIQKLQQPTQLIRKDTSGKQLKVKPAVEITGPGPWQQVKNRLFAPKPGVSSTRQKATVVLVPVLGIVFVFALRQVIGTAPRKTKGAIENNATGVAAAADSDSVIDWQIPEPYPTTLRDPMRLGLAGDAQDEIEIREPKTARTKEFVIKGILYSEDSPSAIIGTQIVHEGDKVSGATVVKIEKNNVEFERNGQRWKQRIRE